jgi:hypothetical protein
MPSENSGRHYPLCLILKEKKKEEGLVRWNIDGKDGVTDYRDCNLCGKTVLDGWHYRATNDFSLWFHKDCIEG